jgi:hypothetical protein
MPTFVYAPGVKVYIETSTGILDVSDDLIQGSMQRRSDGVSNFEFALQNRQRQYDQKFMPNDRIVVMMKRVAWVRVFTGYLNSAPLFTAWPTTINLSSSCSLKRLQYWFWDSYAPYTQNMIRIALGQGAQGRGDGGASSVALAVLEKVVGWSPNKVHIGKIPSVWLDWAYEIAQSIQKEADGDAPDLTTILGNGTGTSASTITITTNGPVTMFNPIDLPAAAEEAANSQMPNILNPVQKTVTATTSGTNSNATVTPGKYGGYDFTAERIKAVSAIWNVGIDQRRDDETLAFTVYVAICESNLNYLSHDPGQASLGMFQQELTNADRYPKTDKWYTPEYQTRKFFIYYDARKNGAKRYGNNPNWLRIAQVVQRFSKTGQYAKKDANGNYLNVPNPNIVKAARAIIAEFRKKSTTSSSVSTPGSSSGNITGSQILEKSLLLNNQNIPYIWGAHDGTATIAELKTKGLDCSGLVYWTFRQALGKSPGFGPQTSIIFNYCKDKGGTVYAAPESSSDPLWRIPGALLFVKNRGGQEGDNHIGIAIGDGTKKAMQARKRGYPAGVATDNWTHILFPPNVDFASSGSGTDSSFVTTSTTSYEYPDYFSKVPPSTKIASYDYSSIPVSLPEGLNVGSGGGQDDLFGALWYPGPISETEQSAAASLTGIRALMNDQPLLPFLQNLMISTQRSFCSAPNGDFIAWFPDFYGIWGTAAKMIIEPIELQDFQVYWSDDFFVTHQYVIAGQYNYLNVATGKVETQNPAFTGSADIRTQTLGIATIEIPAIMKGLFGIDVDDSDVFKNWVYKKFGARPDFQMMDGLVGLRSEFFAALYLFMRQWVYQYTADIPLTFMPELYPGMLIQIPYLDFQAYVVGVTHTFQFGQGGSFGTVINICAPSRLPKNDSDQIRSFIGLPDFGGINVDGLDTNKYNKNLESDPGYSPEAEAARRV